MKFAKRPLCLFLTVLLVLSSAAANVYAAPQENGTAEGDTLPLESGYAVETETTATYTASGNETFVNTNENENDYLWYGKCVRSYLMADDSGWLRISALKVDKVLVERFDSSCRLKSQKYLDMELSLFGGFYAGKDDYYLVFGQSNKEEDNEKDVVRVVKYNKNWERQGSVSLKGANTVWPFDAGCLRMAESNGYLYVRTCHEMYTAEDGYNHQGNMTIVVSEEDMSLAGFTDFDSSHSFNQFILFDDTGNLITLDHCDGNPSRGALLRKFFTEEGEDYPFASGLDYGYFDGDNNTILNVLPYQGEAGDNDTRSTVGGLEYSDSSYLTAGSSAPQDAAEPSYRDVRNVYVTITDRNNFTAEGTSIRWFTDYQNGGGISAGSPQLVRLSGDSFLLLWTQLEEESCDPNGKFFYVFLDGKGNAISSVYSGSGVLSDCKPVVSGGKATWFVADDSKLTFYSVSPDGTLTKKDAVYPADMVIYPHSIEECQMIFSKIGPIAAESEEFEKYLRIIYGDKMLIADEDYELGGASYSYYPGDNTLCELSQYVEGEAPYYAGGASLTACPIRSQSILNSVKAVDGGIKLTWEQETGAVGYKIYRKTGSGSFSFIKTIDTNSVVAWTDTDVQKGTKYSYCIRAYTRDGEKVYYADQSSTLSAVAPLPSPVLSSAANVSGGVKVKWEPVAGAGKYRVFRKSGSGGWKKVGDTASTSLTDQKAEPGTVYYYTVRCITDDGKTYISTYDTKGLKIRCLAKSTIAGISNTADGIRIKWNKIKGASGYYVYRKTGDNTYKKIKTITDAGTVTYTDTAVKSKNGTTYYYAVRAYWGTSISSYAGKGMVRLTGTTISDLTNGSGKKITVKWSKNSKASGYQIQYSTNSKYSSAKTVTVKGTSSLSKTITGLTKGKTYYVRVRVYKTVSGKNYYSAWTGSKKIKISR